MRIIISITAVCALCVTLISCSSAPKPKANKNSVLLISIDGFRPEFYSERFKSLAPHLYDLAHGGVSAPDGMEPIFPTLTYPNHASLVTGVHSADHGIFSNRMTSGEWYFDEASIRSTTLWQAATSAGKSVAILRWPTTRGARVQWYLPEIFGPGFNSANDWLLLQQNTNPEFLKNVLDSGAVKKIEKSSDFDGLAAQAAGWLFAHENPELTLIHLINVDLVQHQTGTHSPELRKALSETDHLIAQILTHIDPSHTTVLIVGDHGFADVGRVITPDVLFPKKTFGNQLMIQSEGGQAVIRLKAGSEKIAPKVLKILKDHAKGFYTVLSKKDLSDLKAYPDAFCVLETMPGSEFSDEGSEFVRNLAVTRGTHGYLPDRLEMQTGFIAWGRGVTAGREVEYVKLLDIAPTVAGLLGLSWTTQGEAEAGGKPIKILDEKPVAPSGSPSP